MFFCVELVFSLLGLLWFNHSKGLGIDIYANFIRFLLEFWSFPLRIDDRIDGFAGLWMQISICISSTGESSSSFSHLFPTFLNQVSALECLSQAICRELRAFDMVHRPALAAHATADRKPAARRRRCLVLHAPTSPMHRLRALRLSP